MIYHLSIAARDPMHVAGVIEPTLRTAEIRRSSERPTNDLTAYDLYLRAVQYSRSWQRDDIIKALVQ